MIFYSLFRISSLWLTCLLLYVKLKKIKIHTKFSNIIKLKSKHAEPPIPGGQLRFAHRRAGFLQFRSKLGNPWQIVLHQFHVIYDRMCLKHDATKVSLQLSTLLKQLRFLKKRSSKLLPGIMRKCA